LDSQIDPVTRAITVRAILPNDDHILKPGLLMSVELFSNARDSIVVPEDSLIPEGKDNYILIVGADNKIEKRKVTIGTRQPGTVEIVEGLKEGEKLVTHGTMTARPGQTAKIVAEEQGNEDLSKILSSDLEEKPESKKE
jgi:membrane fusion protein (multidrug efflux system)